MGIRPGTALYPIPDKFVGYYGAYISHDRLEAASLWPNDFGKWAKKVAHRENESIVSDSSLKGLYSSLDYKAIIVAGLVDYNNPLISSGDEESLIDLSVDQIAQVIRAQAEGYSSVIFASGRPKAYLDGTVTDSNTLSAGLKVARVSSYEPTTVIDLYTITENSISVRNDGEWVVDNSLFSLIASIDTNTLYIIPEKYYPSLENSVDLATKGYVYERRRDQPSPVISSSVYLFDLYNESAKVSAQCALNLTKTFATENAGTKQVQLSEFGMVKVCWSGESDD